MGMERGLEEGPGMETDWEAEREMGIQKTVGLVQMCRPL
jgi:hypothetical protein